eukprot:scaffold2714_cov153-Pinguiococcus_pyrenoidosus.AAC.1
MGENGAPMTRAVLTNVNDLAALLDDIDGAAYDCGKGNQTVSVRVEQAQLGSALAYQASPGLGMQDVNVLISGPDDQENPLGHLLSKSTIQVYEPCGRPRVVPVCMEDPAPEFFFDTSTNFEIIDLTPSDDE